ncbi:polysaccharide deacetylase family protein [Paenibacillus athensensis]|uniref:Polysaccharide deacetylase family protein n=2 Tax=Paenibacillus athensensis TaxID=1967502 RepID=A0A4Y8PYE6_9BACL|nr:polysaccharide deacetylase family protein [Paenibacillus athensensis]
MKVSKLLECLAAGIFIYSVLPTLLVRMGKLGVYRKGRSGVALTFDDGPDPAYTPQLLDLLKAYRVRATFFVLGSKALRHPELITRMHREGHLIGIHNYVHWTNALMTPGKVRRQLRDSIAVIERITGVQTVYYRPPWGVINIFDLFLLRRVRMVLWSLMVRDWSSNGGKERIRSELLTKMKSGDVIVLHDSGQTLGADENAPCYMLEALAEVLDECLRRGFHFLRIDMKMQMEGWLQGRIP